MKHLKMFNESYSKDDLIDRFIIDVADEIGLTEINHDDCLLGEGFFCLSDPDNDMFWSEYVNKQMKQIVITIVFDKHDEEKRVKLMKSYMDKIVKMGYHSYLEKFPYYQPGAPGHGSHYNTFSYLITISKKPYIFPAPERESPNFMWKPNNNVIHARWGGNSSIKYVV